MRIPIASALCWLLVSVPSFAVQVGDTCQPGDTPPIPGLSCQATDNWVFQMPYMANAKKGDVILSSTCGTIGGLIRQVTPPQRYSHVGIMEEDRTAIRHSIADEDRPRVGIELLAEEGIPGLPFLNGFVPDQIKYGWPGTIDESMFCAYEGCFHQDPEIVNRVVLIKGFNKDPISCPSDTDIIYPAVVKPPFDKDESVRQQLHAIANQAKTIPGHYRFFAYSQADIVGRHAPPGEVAPVQVGWANLTAPNGTVCSQLVWTAARMANVPLEDAVAEPGEDHGTAPGLFRYSEAERQQAAVWLYNTIHNAIYEKSGSIVNHITNLADEAANQLANCFAFDRCQQDTSPNHEFISPGVGNTVSPDDITKWDLPPGGVYGITETAQHRPGEWQREYRWTPSLGTSDLTLVVESTTWPILPLEFAGQGGLDFWTQGDTYAQGVHTYSYSHAFRTIPGGRYALSVMTGVPDMIHPSRGITQMYERLIDVPGDGGQHTMVVKWCSVSVCPDQGWVTVPTDTMLHRRVTVSGSITIKDDDIGGDEKQTHHIQDTVILDPVNHPSHELNYRHCTGGEVRVDTKIVLGLDPETGNVTASTNAVLFEGDSCSSTDREDTAWNSVLLGREDTKVLSLWLVNEESFSDDTAKVAIAIKNERNR